MAEPKVECPSCGGEPTVIIATHSYTIEYSEEQNKWIKRNDYVVYACGICLDDIDTRDIEDILRQVDEL